MADTKDQSQKIEEGSQEEQSTSFSHGDPGTFDKSESEENDNKQLEQEVHPDEQQYVEDRKEDVENDVDTERSPSASNDHDSNVDETFSEIKETTSSATGNDGVTESADFASDRKEHQQEESEVVRSAKKTETDSNLSQTPSDFEGISENHSNDPKDSYSPEPLYNANVSENHANSESDEIDAYEPTRGSNKEGNSGDDDDEDEDEYDPEKTLRNLEEREERSESNTTAKNEPDTSTKKDKTSNIFKGKPAGLPPKPPVNAAERSSSKDAQNKLKEAYNAVMRSEIVKDPNFVNLPQSEQLKLVMQQLKERNVNLSPGISNISLNPNMNYDQVFSYNKPFKNLKNPIPLIPVNEFCKRPNLTSPMTPEEEQDYQEFIKREAHYMTLQNWDEFPDKLRLFIGNLPANTISKQDLFRIFNKYGEVIQIAIKAGYGFAQFRTTEACLDCIRGETNVPLHNKIMRLDASRPQKSKKQGKTTGNIPSRGRDRTLSDSKEKHIRDDRSVEKTNDAKRQKTSTPDCQIYITGKSSVFFIRKVKKALTASQLTIDVEDITHRDISDVISEAAYSGVLGTCVIKEAKVDVQTFENTPDGGIKFDEYADITPEAASDILSKAKLKKYGNPVLQPYNYQPPLYGSANSENNDQYGTNRNNSGRYDYYDSRSKYNRTSNDGNSRIRGARQNSWNNLYQNSPNTNPAISYGNPQPLNYGGQNMSYRQNSPPAVPTVPAVETNSQATLLQTLQNMDPASVQNVISLLQQQQAQQQQQQPLPQTQFNSPIPTYGYQQPLNYGLPVPPPPQNHIQPPSGHVNTLLSQLQNSQPNYNPVPQVPVQQPQNQQPMQSPLQNSTQSLMETLARLSRK